MKSRSFRGRPAVSSRRADLAAKPATQPSKVACLQAGFTEVRSAHFLAIPVTVPASSFS